MAAAVEKSHLVIPFFLLAFFAGIISVGLMYNDFGTSLAGYQDYPTVKYTEWVSYLVAAGPMVGQILFIYIWAVSPSTNKMALIVAAICHLADVYFDVFFKVGGGSFFWKGLFRWESGQLWMQLLYAFADSEIIFQLMSEIFFVAGATLIPKLAPPFVRTVGKDLGAFIREMKMAIGEFRSAFHGSINSHQYENDDLPQDFTPLGIRRPEPTYNALSNNGNMPRGTKWQGARSK
jgi:hypothetical protein